MKQQMYAVPAVAYDRDLVKASEVGRMPTKVYTGNGSPERVECVRFTKDMITPSKTVIASEGEIYCPSEPSFNPLKAILDRYWPDEEWHQYAVWGVWTPGV